MGVKRGCEDKGGGVSLRAQVAQAEAGAEERLAREVSSLPPGGSSFSMPPSLFFLHAVLPHLSLSSPPPLALHPTLPSPSLETR
jgi:hypothetical protein